MAGALKKSTGLTGLLVVEEPHHFLNILYGKILRALNHLPKDYAYRIHTEKLVKERASIVQTTPSVAAVEEKIGCGQVEELIIQAELELNLARKMLVYKPWEPLVEQEPINQWTWPPYK